MNYIKKTTKLIDNYVIARWQNRPSTALFWYLPELAIDLQHYKQSDGKAPPYLMDYRKKLQYSLQNTDGIIVLPYDQPIGHQINPEAAFQYALGLHDAGMQEKFLTYAEYFLHRQTKEGLWHYNFDWFIAKAPWSSALAQARGASVMMRAWLHSQDARYLTAAKNALAKFLIPTANGGFLHPFSRGNCLYFEEYPTIPTGVINGFMAALISIWDVAYWIKESWLENLWQGGIASLEKMLPHYSLGWWSLYDLDTDTPVPNVNSPRYHVLEMEYLKILSTLSESETIAIEYKNRCAQYKRRLSRGRALSLKLVRKILYK